MFHLKDKLLWVFVPLVVHHTAVILLLTHCCEAQPQAIGPSQTIVGTLGDVITLPCRLEPSVHAAAATVEWTRLDLNPRFVFVFRDGAELQSKTPPSYRGRTSLSVDGLKHGDISLRLSGIQLSDEGTYRCFIPRLGIDANMDLVVRSAPSPVTVGIARVGAGVMLECESAGWYPEPEVLWLNAEGHMVSAGPTEMFRGPDGLYTVRSSVTVEHKHNNTFTCKLQHKYTSHTTAIYLYDDFSVALPPAVHGIIRVVVVVVVVVVFALVVWLLVRKWRRNGIAAKRHHSVENEPKRGEKMNGRVSPDAEAPSVIGEARERKLLLMGSRKRKEKAKRQAELLRKEEELRSMRCAFMEQKKELENQKAKLNEQQEEEERRREQTEKNIKLGQESYVWGPLLKTSFLNEAGENLEWRKSELEKQQQNTEKLLRTIHEGINAEEREDQTDDQPPETQTGKKMTSAEAPDHLNNPLMPV